MKVRYFLCSATAAFIPECEWRPAALQDELLDGLEAGERLAEGEQLVDEHPEAEGVHLLRVLLLPVVPVSITV